MLLSCLPPEICVYKDVIVSWMHRRRHPGILCSDHSMEYDGMLLIIHGIMGDTQDIP
jgi:hypothetical protein